MISFRSVLTSALFALSLPVLAGPPVYSLLQKARPFIKFQDYTLPQKKLVLEQAKLIVNEVYVHRELKIKTFGADPAPVFKDLETNLEKMPTEDFHKKLSSMFTAFRDRHTLYYFPKPFACYQTILPIYLREVTDGTGKRVIAINGLVDNDEVNKLIKPTKIKRGDVVVSYNGEPVEKVIVKNYPISTGANNSAARHLSIQYLRFREHTLDLLPDTNTVKITLKNAQGKTYSEELPWISQKDWQCISEAGGATPPSMNTEEEDVDVFFWQVIKNQYGTFGYIEIPTFDSEKADYWVERFKVIVRDEFKNTDGLIFDVRFNGGGNSSIAEKIIQYFTPKYVKPQLDILKATDTNLLFLKTSNAKDPFTLATLEAQKNGQRYTKPLALNNEASMNSQGQFYFKPIAVFTDGYCYSSCDMFSAHMQDNGAATIFGERETTGAGGGNVFTLDKFIGYMNGAPGPFKQLPYGQDIWFAFRQTIRTGKNAGKLIENEGVKTEIINFPTIKDLMQDNVVQIGNISKYLAKISPSYTSSVSMSEERIDYEVGSTPSVVLSWQDTMKIAFSAEQKVIGASNVSDNADESNVLVPVDTKLVKAGRLDLVGSFKEKDVWRKVLNYRVIPQSRTVAAPVTFNAKDFSFYSTNSAESDGWNVDGNQVQIGGESYQDDVQAEASLFITPSKAMNLSFNADIMTEADCDFFSVIVVSEGKEIILLEPQSGNIPEKVYSYDLSAFVGKKIEIRFKFKSDEGTVSKGVTVKDITLL